MKPTTPEEKNGEKKGFKESTGIPAKFNIEHFLRALKVLSDKGGSVKSGDLKPLFGNTTNLQELHSRALNFSTTLGYSERKGNFFKLSRQLPHITFIFSGLVVILSINL